MDGGVCVRVHACVCARARKDMVVWRARECVYVCGWRVYGQMRTLGGVHV
jgi:hypothetical protein